MDDSNSHQHQGMQDMPGMGGTGGMQHGGHAMGGMAGMDMGDLKRRFWVCLVLALPVVVLSPMMGVSLPFQFTFPGSAILVAVLGTVLYFYGGKPFLTGAAGELRQKAPAMMTLVSLGITVAWAYSMYAFVMNEVLHSGRHVMDFFWELATLIVIMLLGHYVEMRSTMGAGDALKSMAQLLPAEATVAAPDGSLQKLPLQKLRAGQTVVVNAGEKIPADGVVTEGRSAVNESMVTGESRGVAKKAGDKVIGGSLNGEGSLRVKVTGTGESGYIAQVSRLISDAQREKSRAETLADKVARLLFYVAAGAGILAFIAWLLVTRSFDDALSRMVTVLVIACPHALGLAVPLVTARSTTIGAKNGVLVRSRPALEKAQKLDTAMMDKTGTLTEGDFTLRQVVALDGQSTEDDILSAAAALEQGSSHPLAAGILQGAKERGLALQKAGDIQTISGAGLKGTLADGRSALLASPRYVADQKIELDTGKTDALAAGGGTVSVLAVDGRALGALVQGDAIKATAKGAVQALKDLKVTTVMLTGDNEQAAQAVARQLGITQYRAQLQPSDKAGLIGQAKKTGRTVMMVGDGVNDAPALAAADIGVAIGAGTEVAISSADVVLVKSDPADIPRFVQLARATQRKMKQNLWWGAGYNIVAIPLAAGVLAPMGILLSPAVGALLMSLSTVVVALNALTLHIDREK